RAAPSPALVTAVAAAGRAARTGSAAPGADHSQEPVCFLDEPGLSGGQSPGGGGFAAAAAAAAGLEPDPELCAMGPPGGLAAGARRHRSRATASARAALALRDRAAAGRDHECEVRGPRAGRLSNR